eukprot:4393-Heterococcus_DN1.PRE.2
MITELWAQKVCLADARARTRARRGCALLACLPESESSKDAAASSAYNVLHWYSPAAAAWREAARSASNCAAIPQANRFDRRGLTPPYWLL